MRTRYDLRTATPEGLAAVRRLNAHVGACSLPARLLALVRLHPPRIAGCDSCIDLHRAAKWHGAEGHPHAR